MAKKKNKTKKKSISILNEVDKVIDGTYENIREEIEEIQLKLNIAEQAAKKKAKKKGKRAKQSYETDKGRMEIRKEIVEQHFEGKGNILDRFNNPLKDLAPIVIVIARLVASLILCILSLDRVKLFIKPETLDKMNTVYKKAMSIC